MRRWRREKSRLTTCSKSPRKRGEPDNAPPRYDLKLRLEDHPEIAEAINLWIAGPWTDWSTLNCRGGGR